MNEQQQQDQQLQQNQQLQQEQLQQQISRLKEQWNEITVEDLDNVMSKIEEFYDERPEQRLNLIWLSDSIIKRLKNDSDFWLVCEGMRGRGKSNLLLILGLLIHRNSGFYLNKTTGKIVEVLPQISRPGPEFERLTVNFSFKMNMSFLDNSNEIKNKFNALSRYSFFIIDEGSKTLHKYLWQSRLQFLLVQLSDTERYQNKCAGICIPNFQELNTVFRNDRTQARLFVYYRNTAKHYSSCILSFKDEGRYSSDVWHIEENAKTYNKLLHRIPVGLRTPQQVANAEKKLVGYVSSFDVPSLKHISKKLWNIYMDYKVRNAQKELSESDVELTASDKKIFRLESSLNQLINFIKSRDKTVSYKEIALGAGMSQSQLASLKSKVDKLTLKKEIDK